MCPIINIASLNYAPLLKHPLWGDWIRKLRSLNPITQGQFKVAIDMSDVSKGRE
jgi:hypothetical protein